MKNNVVSIASKFAINVTYEKWYSNYYAKQYNEWTRKDYVSAYMKLLNK